MTLVRRVEGWPGAYANASETLVALRHSIANAAVPGKVVVVALRHSESLHGSRVVLETDIGLL